MTRFENLTEFAIKFGQHAQAVLDFISNEENIRKFNAIKQSDCRFGGFHSTNAAICIALDNNRFVTKEEWSNGKYSTDDVVGIAVRTPVVSFIVGLTEWRAKWSDNNTLPTKSHTEAQALQVVSGLEATRKIVEAQNDEEKTAAKLCWNYGHKGLQWYLPSLLELSAICAYRNEINELMAFVSYARLSTGFYWSSAEESILYSWNVCFADGSNFSHSYKSNVATVRPVTAI